LAGLAALVGSVVLVALVVLVESAALVVLEELGVSAALGALAGSAALAAEIARLLCQLVAEAAIGSTTRNIAAAPLIATALLQTDSAVRPVVIRWPIDRLALGARFSAKVAMSAATGAEEPA
jgi:hypothetical protein